MEEYVSTPLKNIGNVIESTVSRKLVLKNEDETHATYNPFVIGKAVNGSSVSKELVMNINQSSQVVNVLEDGTAIIPTNGSGRQIVSQENPVANITSDVDVLGPIKSCIPTSLTNESTAVIVDQRRAHNMKIGSEKSEEKNYHQNNNFFQGEGEPACFVGISEREMLSNSAPRSDKSEKCEKNDETLPSQTDCTELTNPNLNIKLTPNNNVSSLVRIESEIKKDPIGSPDTELIRTSNCPNRLCMPTMNCDTNKLALDFSEIISEQVRKECDMLNTQSKTVNDSSDVNRKIKCVSENEKVECQSGLGSLEEAHVNIVKQCATPCLKMASNRRHSEGDLIGIQEKTPNCKKRRRSSPNIFCEWARLLRSSTPYERTKCFDPRSANQKLYQMASTPKSSINNKFKNEEIKKICFGNVGDQDGNLSEISPSSPHGQEKIIVRSDCEIKSVNDEDNKTYFDISGVTTSKKCNSNISSSAINEQLETSHSNNKRPASPPIELQDGVKKAKLETSPLKTVIEIDLTEDRSGTAGVSLNNCNNYNNEVLRMKPNIENDELLNGTCENNAILINNVGNATDTEICKFKSEVKEKIVMIDDDDDECEILNEVPNSRENTSLVPFLRKRMKLMKSDVTEHKGNFVKEVKAVTNEEVELIVLDDNDNFMNSEKGVNEIEIAENKPTGGDERRKLKKGSVENFVSNDPKENDDNNNPEWQLLKILETDDERYKAVRLRWRNLVKPDPNKNLTCIHIKPTFKHPNICLFEPNMKNDGNSRNSRKRTHSHEPTTSTDHVHVKRSRTRSCITTYDKKVRDVELKIEQKEKKLCEEKQCALADSQSFYHWQRESLRTSNLRYYNNWEYQNQIAMLNVQQRKAEEAVHQNFGIAFDRLEDEKNREALVFKKAMKEVEAFHKFYRKLDVESSDNDCFFLTDVELDDVVEIDKLYEKFNHFYG